MELAAFLLSGSPGGTIILAAALRGSVDVAAAGLGEIIAGKPACCLSVAPGIIFCTIGAILLLPGVAFGIGIRFGRVDAAGLDN